jgi:putative transposase
VNEAIEYIVAVLAQRYQILLHALCGMSNHMHNVETDTLGRVVEFERDYHAILARVINSLFGEFESLWARQPSGRITCVQPADVIDKIAYTMANPVEARLVAHGKSWPGVRMAWPRKPRRIRRPDWFFRGQDEGGTWPGEVTLELHRPPGYDHLSDDELAALIKEQIEAREAAARAKAQVAGERFLGRRGVLEQSRYGYPSSDEKRFALRPTVACRSKWHRIERLLADSAWLEEYEACKARVKAGEQNVIFPYGTWKLRVYYRFACDPPPGLAHLAA